MSRRERIGAIAVAALAAAARSAVLLATPGYVPIHDDASYARTAATLLRFGRYPVHRVPHVGLQPSAYRPPGWPGTLWALWRLTGVDVGAARVLLVVLGTAACLLAAHVARRLAGPGAGLAAGLLLALDPLMLAVGASLESETLFTVLVLGALAAALEARGRRRLRWALVAGALAGAAALTRTNGLLLVPVLAAVAVPVWRLRGPGRPLLQGVAVLLVAAAAIAPWTVRNAVVLHRFVPVSTETGNTLAGTYNTTSLHEQARWLEPRRVGAYRELYRRLGPGAQLDAALLPAVARWVERHPSYPAVVVAWNTRRLLGFAGPAWAALSLRTMSLGAGAGTAVWLGTMAVTLLALAAVLVLGDRRRTLWPALAVAVALLVSTVPATGEMRLAAPLQAVLAVAAGAAFAELARRRPWAGARVVAQRRATMTSRVSGVNAAPS